MEFVVIYIHGYFYHYTHTVELYKERGLQKPLSGMYPKTIPYDNGEYETIETKDKNGVITIKKTPIREITVYVVEINTIEQLMEIYEEAQLLIDKNKCWAVGFSIGYNYGMPSICIREDFAQ